MDITISIVLLAAVVTGFNEVLKKAVGDKIKRFLPLISVIEGVIASFAFHFEEEIFSIIVIGLIIGLTAVGYFESGKQLKE